MKKFSRFLVLVLAASSFLFTFSQQGIEKFFSGMERTYLILQPGDKINDMVITTGVENAFPLWAVCAPKKVNDYSIMADCGQLSYNNLVIGHTLGVMDLVDPTIAWEELNWEMFIDGHPIDLPAFGVYDFVHPDIAMKPSPVREVFRVVRVWDVVLVNPTPGFHRLEGQALSSDRTAIYTWLVDFTVTPPLRPVKGGKS